MDPYAILHVARYATGDEIRKSYYDLARKTHPDKNSSEEKLRRFQEIAAAYEILSDPEQRIEWDRRHPPTKMFVTDVMRHPERGGIRSGKSPW